MQQGTLITITGIDGAGKSTLARNVTDALRGQGHDVVYAYGRFLPVLSYPVMEIGRRTLLSDSDIESEYTTHQSRKEHLFEILPLRRAYELLVMMDYAPQLFTRVLVPLYKHDYVVCDRYFYDTLLTDLSGDVVQTPQKAIERYQFYSQLVPAPDFEFYVSIKPEIAIKRKDDVPDIEYLRDRKSFYDLFAEANDMTVLDGTDTKEALCDTVVQAVTDGS